MGITFGLPYDSIVRSNMSFPKKYDENPKKDSLYHGRFQRYVVEMNDMKQPKNSVTNTEIESETHIDNTIRCILKELSTQKQLLKHLQEQIDEIKKHEK